MKAERLLRLYPAAWRERYGEEFLAMLEDQPPGGRAKFDIILGAIDARLSSKGRIAASGSTPEGGGVMTMETLKHLCANRRDSISMRDTWIGTAIVLGSALAFSALGMWLRARDWPIASQLVLIMAYPCSVMMAMPFLWLKGRPWRAQLAFMGTTLVFLFIIAWIAAVT